jgi:hypothetical protein
MTHQTANLRILVNGVKLGLVCDGVLIANPAATGL